MLMRFVKTLCLVALVAISAAAAHAGSIGTDPKVTINCTKNCPGAVGSNFSPSGDPSFMYPMGFTKTDPLTLAYGVGESLDYTYTGPDVYVSTTNSGPLLGKYKYLYVEITGIPTDLPTPPTFNCGGNVFFPACFGVTGPIFSGDTYSEIFWFSDGELSNGATYSVSEQPAVNATPEPSTMLMFFSLGPALAFAKKRWNARQSA
jgi:hypothetical protein